MSSEQIILDIKRKKRLAGDIVRRADTSDITNLRREARDSKWVVTEQPLNMLGIAHTAFYRWYERFRLEGQDVSAILDDFSRYVITWQLCTSTTSRACSRTMERVISRANSLIGSLTTR